MSHQHISQCTTNIFPLTNLSNLDEYYILYKIRTSSPLLERDKQYITKKLSYELKHPVVVIQHEGENHLVLIDDNDVIEKLPPKLNLVGKRASFENTGTRLRLDFSAPSPEVKKICLRFLQFTLQGQLAKKHNLWQPASGEAFFEYSPFRMERNIDIFNGFSARVVETIDNGFGISIDITKKYISTLPYATYLNSTEFSRFCRGNNCLYKYGKRWYEIKPLGISDSNVSEAEIQIDNDYISLLEHIRLSIKGEYSPELADLPEDATIFNYKNNTEETRHAPTGMCFRVFDTEDKEIGKLHDYSILKPHIRYNEICKIQNTYLRKLSVKNKLISVDKEPISERRKYFVVPDLEFGNNQVISLRKSPNTHWITLPDLRHCKKECALNSKIGFYSANTASEFWEQLLVMPRSVYDKMGVAFVQLLKMKVEQMFPNESGWNPRIITYEDKIGRNQDYVNVGFRIIDAIDKGTDNPSINGKCIVMIPEVGKMKRRHDELAALVTTELKGKGIDATILHATTTEQVFVSINKNGKYEYVVHPKYKNFYDSYLTNVALVKVLINNEKYPFRLYTPLNADLTIGIDVKHNTACYTFINKYGDSIRQDWKHSNEKEKLTKEQVCAYLISNIGNLITESVYGYSIENIVIHRDGRLFETEFEGIEQALNVLKAKGVKSISVVEIQKSSPAPFRIFNKISNTLIKNPSIGTYYFVNQHTALLCSTGDEYPLRGTVKPLSVKYHSGEMSFESILEDIFFLSNLTFTKLDSCSRVPLSIKLTDLKLRTIASKYDNEQLEYLKEIETQLTN